METRQMSQIETKRTTELKLTGADIIEALKRGNSKLFKDATAVVTVGDVLISADVPLVVTVTQVTKKEK